MRSHGSNHCGLQEVYKTLCQIEKNKKKRFLPNTSLLFHLSTPMLCICRKSLYQRARRLLEINVDERVKRNRYTIFMK